MLKGVSFILLFFHSATDTLLSKNSLTR